jgi:hypothetical protein
VGGLFLLTFITNEMPKTNETTHVVCQTGGKLLNLLKSKGQSAPQYNSIQENASFIFGLDSLYKLLNYSKPTTAKLMNSGRVSFIKTGRQLIFDRKTVLFELGNTPKTV